MSTPPAYKIYEAAKHLNEDLSLLPPLSPSASSDLQTLYRNMTHELTTLRRNIPRVADSDMDGSMYPGLRVRIPMLTTTIIGHHPGAGQSPAQTSHKRPLQRSQVSSDEENTQSPAGRSCGKKPRASPSQNTTESHTPDRSQDVIPAQNKASTAAAGVTSMTSEVQTSPLVQY